MKKTVGVAIALVALFLLSLSNPVTAQQQSTNQPEQLAMRGDVFCTGFIADVAPRVGLEVIGGLQEDNKIHYSEGDVVFLNQGRGSGVLPGAVYYVIRPLGDVRHPFTHKKMGVLVRELGLLRVLEVQDQTSTAQVTMSCDVIELGDLLKPYEEMHAPKGPDARPLPKYGEGSGGLEGQIVMAPGNAEYLSAHRVVYIDVGERQDVRPGDNFTIFREVGASEGITHPPLDHIVQERSIGYESDRYRGGTTSNQAVRVHRGDVVATRPPLPRKVVGELVVIKVEKNTAVAMITRTTAEINIGDLIERSNQ
jgi:hypothetical protein